MDHVAGRLTATLLNASTGSVYRYPALPSERRYLDASAMPDFSFDIATPIPQAPENGVQVFKSPNQPDWRVFVQAGPSGISIRRQLIRTLRQAGATIEIDPKDARVILVEPASREGRILIRNWSGLLDKAVLNYQWVQKSMAAGRPLDERENWGECQALDDGLPIEEEVDGDDCFQLPGPSPARKPPSRKVPKEQVQVATTVDTTPTVPTKSTESQSYPLQSNTSINSQNPPYQAKEQGSVPAQLVPQALAPHSAMMQTMANMFSTTQQASPVQLTQEQQHVMISLLASHQFFGMPFWNQYPLVANGVPPLPSPFAGLSQTPTQPPLSAHSQGSVAAQSSPPPPPESQHIPKPKSKVPPSKRKATASASVQRPGSRSVSAGPSQSPHPQAFLFLSSSGDPLTFFVQINLKDRRNVVGRIQKGGGRIISDHAEADYAILSSQADHFNTLLDQITAAGKRAQNANFVHACFEGNKIVDPSPFTFDAPTTSKKRRTASVKQEDTSPHKSHRKRSPTDSPITSIKTKKPRGAAEPSNGSQSMPPTSVLQDDAPMTASPLVVSKPVKRIETNGKGPSKVKTEKKSAPAVHSGERSPTPPPPETRRAGMKGYFFTEEEDQYALRYIKILLNRDPEMTMTGIAKALYSKMEHHTIGSYMTHLGANHKQDIAALRKRASIALRKRENEVRLRTSISMDSPGPSTPESARNADDGFAARLEKDLDTVTNYFAFGGGDPGDGEEERETIWRRLSDQAECQTATSWEDFYTVHNEEVVRRFEALVKQEG